MHLPQSIRWPLPSIFITINHGNLCPMIRPAISLVGIAVLTALVLVASKSPASSPVVLSAFTAAPDESTIFPIYSNRLTDPWNRVFHCLFTRTLRTRISDEFPRSEAGPFVNSGDFLNLRVSTRTFDQTESGDRPIDPLYAPPPFTGDGPYQVLIDPRYSMLIAALHDALNDTTPRSSLARAIFQTDLWSAYDILHWDLYPKDRGTILDGHKHEISDLLARLIRKLALTPQEIEALPENYAVACAHDSLPDLFSPNSDWIELQWLLPRTHDAQSNFRRASRVFVKPSQVPKDKQKFLNSLRTGTGLASPGVAGAAILVQPLLIDLLGRPTPSHLTTDVEVRLFQWAPDGKLQATHVHTYELSRSVMLRDPSTGGLVVKDRDSPVYLSAGGSYGFAEPTHFTSDDPSQVPSALIVKLRTRCARCHGENLDGLMTFTIALPPHSHTPSVKELNPAAHQIADYDVSRKSKSAEWRALQAYFANGTK
jgi:hypothetical protein